MDQVDLDRVVPWAEHQDHSAKHCEAGDRMLVKLADELRVARHALDLLRPARAQVRQLLDDDGLRGDLPASIRRTLRQVHADLDGAVAAYDQAGEPT